MSNHRTATGELHAAAPVVSLPNDKSGDDPTRPEPYVALTGSEFIKEADTLEELLRLLDAVYGPPGVDVAVWHGCRLVLGGKPGSAIKGKAHPSPWF
jgi:hypothetical protein